MSVWMRSLSHHVHVLANFNLQYRLNGDDEFCDPTEPHTTACPFLPGQDVNVLDVPIENIDDTVPFPGSDIPWSSVAHTLDPQDKFLELRPAPLPPACHHSTANHKPRIDLKSPNSPLSGSANEHMALYESSKEIDHQLQNTGVTCGLHGLCTKPATEIPGPSVEPLTDQPSLTAVRAKSCPNMFRSANYATSHFQRDALRTYADRDYRPSTSYMRPRDVSLLSLSPPHLESVTSSPTDIDSCFPLPELDDDGYDLLVQRPLTTLDKFNDEAEPPIFRFVPRPENGLDAGRLYAARRERFLGLKIDAESYDTRYLIPGDGRTTEDPDSAITTLEEEYLSSPHTSHQNQPEACARSDTYSFVLQEASPRIFQSPETAILSDPVGTPHSPPIMQGIQLGRPGLLRSKFSEWSVTSADFPQTTSSPAPEVEDIQSPSLSAVSYSSDGIVTPRKPSEQDIEYVNQMIAPDYSAENSSYRRSRERYMQDGSYEADTDLIGIVADFCISEDSCTPRQKQWGEAVFGSAGAGADTTPRSNFLPDYFGIGANYTASDGQMSVLSGRLEACDGSERVVDESKRDNGLPSTSDIIDEFEYLGAAIN